MKSALVISIAARDSLGAMKLAKWLERDGVSVTTATELTMFDAGYDLYAFSVVFSWRLPECARQASLAKQWGEVWIGGPAVTFSRDNAEFIRRETGIEPHIGLDQRFEREAGAFPMVYFSRGCPAYTPACGLCPVPRLEGTKFTYYPNATPAPLLLDNNLSALPDEYQDHIIERYKEFPKRVDANSGFEPHTFTEKTLRRWEKFPLLFWRFGFDDISERDAAQEMMGLLKANGKHGDNVRVYTILGNEPPTICLRRIREVIEHGFHPWPQRVRPLNWLGGDLPCQHGWNEPLLIAVQRFYSNAALWKTIEPSEYFYNNAFPFRELAA